jgi:hypothetical protein
MHVAVGFMPASKYRQKNSLMVFEGGHEARGYVFAEETSNYFLSAACQFVITVTGEVAALSPPAGAFTRKR